MISNLGVGISVRGDTVEVRPAELEEGRVEFAGDEIDRITRFDPLTGNMLESLRCDYFPWQAVRHANGEHQARLEQFAMSWMSGLQNWKNKEAARAGASECDRYLK